MRDSIKKYLKKRIDNPNNIERSIDLIINGISCMCEKHNLNFLEIEFLGGGESSLVLAVGDRVIKVTFMFYFGHESLMEYVSYSDNILHPQDEQSLNIFDSEFPIKILLLKKLTMGNISEQDLLDMYIKLRDEGYLWSDLRKDNLGRDEFGKILLLDYGELIYINDLDEQKRLNYLGAHAGRVPELDKFYKTMKSMLKSKRIK